MRLLMALPLVLTLSTAACAYHHEARVVTARLPPPAIEMVKHTGRLYVEAAGTRDRQCFRKSGQSALCFAGIQQAIGHALEQTLWPSFPGVKVKERADNLEPGDFLLLVDLELSALAADESGPGWSAEARGHWQLVRDGIPMARENVRSRSRADYPFGRALGSAAGGVLDAVALHVATVVGQLPETRPLPSMALPEVVAVDRVGPLFAGPSCHSSDDAKRCSIASR